MNAEEVIRNCRNIVSYRKMCDQYKNEIFSSLLANYGYRNFEYVVDFKKTVLEFFSLDKELRPTLDNFISAVEYDLVHVIRLLSGLKFLDTKGKRGIESAYHRALLVAIEWNNLEIVKFLADEVNMNIRDIALAMAAELNRTSILKVLLRHNASEKAHFRAYYAAASRGRLESLKLLKINRKSLSAIINYPRIPKKSLEYMTRVFSRKSRKKAGNPILKTLVKNIKKKYTKTSNFS